MPESSNSPPDCISTALLFFVGWFRYTNDETQQRHNHERLTVALETGANDVDVARLDARRRRQRADELSDERPKLRRIDRYSAHRSEMTVFVSFIETSI